MKMLRILASILFAISLCEIANAQEKLSLSWPVAKKDSVMNSLGTPLSNSNSNFSMPEYFHQGVDIISPAGSSVFSPVDANRIMIVKNEDYNIHLFVTGLNVRVIINHMSLTKMPEKFASLEQGKIYNLAVKRGELLGKVEDGYGTYMNHVHLEVRQSDESFINPLLFFKETTVEKNSPVIKNIFFCNDEQLIPLTKEIPFKDGFKICVETYDTLNPSLQSVVKIGSHDEREMENIKINPIKISFNLNEKTISVLDFSMMKSDCESDAKLDCHYVQTLLKPSDVMFISKNSDLSSVGGEYIAKDADDVDNTSFDLKYYGRRYIYKTDSIRKELLIKGKNKVVVEVRDAAQNKTSEERTFLYND